MDFNGADMSLLDEDQKYTRKCAFCDTPFTTDKEDKIYCTDYCKVLVDTKDTQPQ